MPKAPPSPDMVGQELAVGDTVLFNPPNSQGIKWGKVKRVMPKTLKIEFTRGNWQGVPYVTECNRRSAETVKLNEEQLLGVAQQKLAGLG